MNPPSTFTAATTRLDYRHVDVFAAEPLCGNGLTVFQLQEPLPDALMQRITQEMRQFESIFLWREAGSRSVRARIFTMEEELGFAGHPVLGAACVLHAEHFADEAECRLVFELAARQVELTSRRQGLAFEAEMAQGVAEFGAPIDLDKQRQLLAALNLQADDAFEHAPMEVVSTGLPYLIVPVRSGLARTAVTQRGFEALLGTVGAKFAYVLDVPQLEGRTWDNDGRVEDIATGSAAGPAGAWLARHGLIERERPVTLHQGRFLHRPSELIVTVSGTAQALSVCVKGAVAFAGRGHLELPASYFQSLNEETRN